MNSLMQDVRYAARILARSPGFTVVAVLTLALGIGAISAAFSIVNSVLLRPLSYPEAHELVRFGDYGTPLLLPRLAEWEDNLESFERIAWYAKERGSLTGGEQPRRIGLAKVSVGFFKVFDLVPSRGRLLEPEDQRSGAPPAALLSEGFWESEFGGDLGQLGRTVTVDGTSYTVVGVVNSGSLFGEVDVWLPGGTGEDRKSANAGFPRQPATFYARLRDGVSYDQGRVELETRYLPLGGTGLLRETRRYGAGESMLSVGQVEKETIGSSHRFLYRFFATAGFVWLLVCANVASLLLARGIARQRELAVRAAVGASRQRIFFQMITENGFLGLLAGAAGYVLAFWILRLLVVNLPRNIPRQSEISVDATVLLFALVCSTASILIFGVIPALRARRFDINSVLRRETPGLGSGRSRLGSMFVVAQVSLATVLLVGAGLMVHSFFRLKGVDLGVNQQGVYWIKPTLSGTAHSQVDASWDFLRTASRQLELIPAVESVGAIGAGPLSGSAGYTTIRIKGFSDNSFFGAMSFMSPGYFRAMGIPLVAGRFPDERDRANRSPVAVISEGAAREFSSPQEALGRRIRLPDSMVGASGVDVIAGWVEVIGVVRDVRQGGPQDEIRPQTYFPYWHAKSNLAAAIVVRLRAGQRLTGEQIRQAVWTVDGNVPVQVQSMDQKLDVHYAIKRQYAILFGFLASLAVTIAAVGLFGLIAYSVSQRTREIGVRMALGAQRGNVLRMVLRQGMTLIGIGIAAGLVASYWLTKYLKSFLFEVEPTDPITFAAVAVLLAVVALAACWIPARRATRVDPMTALRYE